MMPHPRDCPCVDVETTRRLAPTDPLNANRAADPRLGIAGPLWVDSGRLGRATRLPLLRVGTTFRAIQYPLSGPRYAGKAPGLASLCRCPRTARNIIWHRAIDWYMLS
jgi:hypothetical protein